jgi:glycine betaine/proline transport system substrate-binding protein
VFPVHGGLIKVLPTRFTTRRAARWTILALALALGATGCTDAKSSGSAAGSAEVKPTGCDSFTIAVNPWIGYKANASVVAYLAQTQLGCRVSMKELTEEESWKGLASGEVDVILENWGHEDLKKKYVDQEKKAVVVGPTGNAGAIGWYVPPWMKKAYPDIVDWKNLNKYADLFKTGEAGAKGQLLDGDPSFVTNDEALINNLGLNYKVVYAGSELELIKAFQSAEEQKTPLIGYFFEPQWLHLDLKLVKINLPPYTPGCDADPKTVACDYPSYVLDKIVSKKFADTGGPAYQLVKNFQWTNTEQNTVASFMDVYKMQPAEAAKRWAQANPDRVEEWLGKL